MQRVTACRKRDCDLPRNRFQSPQTALSHHLAEAGPDHTEPIDLRQVNNSAFGKSIVLSAITPLRRSSPLSRPVDRLDLWQFPLRGLPQIVIGLQLIPDFGVGTKCGGKTQ
jgi:hypothetical protein